MDIKKHITIEPIRTLKDNYVWAIINHEQHNALIVDPGEAQPVLDFLANNKLSLLAILITHHHWDHTNGIAEILKHYDVPVYGNTNENIPHLTHFVSAAAKVNITGFPLAFDVLDIPGHTSGHIAYYSPGMVFCGDTLFSAGCGRLFEGTAEQMYSSLQKIFALPDDTKVYCAHEYTLNNLKFANTVEPGNKHIIERIQYVTELRQQDHPSIPSTLEVEKATNPFLRCHSAELKTSVEQHANEHLNTPLAVFAALRKWKDQF